MTDRVLRWRPQRGPDPLRGGGHVDVPDAQVRDARRRPRSARRAWRRSCPPRRCPWPRAGCSWSAWPCRPARSSAPRWRTGTGSRRSSRSAGCRRRRRRPPRRSAWAAPWAMPPCRWPSASSGLSTMPASSTVITRRSTTLPVSVSTSTTATWRAEREGRARRAEHRPHQQPLGLGQGGQRDRRVRVAGHRERAARRRRRPGRPGWPRARRRRVPWPPRSAPWTPAGPRRRPAAGCATRRCRRPRGPGRCRPT